MKKKVLALLLAGSMLFGQNVYATDMASTENADIAKTVDTTENVNTVENADETKNVDNTENVDRGEADSNESISELEESQKEMESDCQASEYEVEQNTEKESNIGSDIDTTNNGQSEKLYSAYTNDKTQIVYVGNPVMVEVSVFYGRDPYTAYVSDDSICTAELKESYCDSSFATRYVQLNPIKAGTVTLSVKDSYGTVNYEQNIEVRQALPDDAVPIKDAALKGYLLQQKNFGDDGYVSYDELKQLTSIDIRENMMRTANYVSDLSGLEYAINLSRLTIFDTRVTDLTPISNLKQLTLLDIEGNGITDLAALSNMKQLINLYIGESKVTDLSPLCKLTQLANLSINNLDVEDISYLKNLVNLTSLDLSNTKISDCSAIANMDKLKQLTISDSNVSNLSFAKNLKNLVDLRADNTKISDVTQLSSLLNLKYLSLNGCNGLTSIKSLAAASKLKVLWISDTNVSDGEKLELICSGKDNSSYNKGEKLAIPDIHGMLNAGDNLQVNATNGDVNSVRIDKNSSSDVDVVAVEAGKIELTLKLNDTEKKLNISVNGVQSSQPVGKDSSTTITDSEVNDWDYYTEEYNQVSSAILTSNGDLWQTYPKTKKLQSNVKKYVSKWIYSQGAAEVVDYRIDNNNGLWSGDKKIAENVKDVDGHYALTNDNSLIDLYHTNGYSIPNVKDWREREKWTLILKNDGTLLTVEEAKKDAKQNDFETIATGVKELVGEGYLTYSGDYIRILFNWDASREYFTIGKNVESVDYDRNCFYGKDGNCYLDAYHTGDHVNVGKNKVKIWTYLYEDGAWNNYVIFDDNKLYCVTHRQNSDYSYTDTMTFIADGIDSMYGRDSLKVKTTDDQYYELVNGELKKIEEELTDVSSFRLDGNEYSLEVKQGETADILNKNDVNILDNVKYIWCNCVDAFALRTDGSIWNVTGVPKMIIDSNGNNAETIPGDVDGDDKVSTKDLMIVLYGVSGRNELTEDQKTAADIDGDGKVTVSDLTRVLYYVSGRNSTL